MYIFKMSKPYKSSSRIVFLILELKRKEKSEAEIHMYIYVCTYIVEVKHNSINYKK